MPPHYAEVESLKLEWAGPCPIRKTFILTKAVLPNKQTFHFYTTLSPSAGIYNRMRQMQNVFDNG